MNPEDQATAAGPSAMPRDGTDLPTRTGLLPGTDVPRRATAPVGPPVNAPPSGPPTGAARGPRPQKKIRRRDRIIAAVAILVMLSGIGLAVGTYYVDSVPTPNQLALPESTTVYYSDGRTPMAKLGTENRTILALDDMTDDVKETIVAAEDQTFWENEGIDFAGVLRAAWNNFTGGKTQGASTITQQYARIAADLKGVTYSRKLREAVIAWKLADTYSKEKILGFYLNTVPFGRGAYGVEAGAQAFFGKSANKNAPAARRLTLSEAMVLVAMVKQPEADPDDPEGHPGYDPTRSARAEQNSRERWAYIRDAMVGMGKLTSTEAALLKYPDTVKPFDESSLQSGLDLPTGLVVSHALSELRQSDPFKGKPKDYIQNGGYRIITTIDKRAQDAAVAAADIKGDKAPEVVRGQPKNWQAALVAVQPGTGRVLAYYGGNAGAGADYAGWFYDEDGQARGFGQHPPGSSFKVYDLAEAIREGISVKSRWDTPATKEFPASGRTNGSAAGPVRNAGKAACQPNCTLWEATVASLNVAFFDLTEKIGPANVIDMAIKAGVDSMWANVKGQPSPVRVELRGKSGKDVAQQFSTEVGIGQYGITVMDHANGMATFAADGKRAGLHFVQSVTEGDDEVYKEKLDTVDVGLTKEQIDELNWTLSKVPTAKLSNNWDSAGKTGTWQAGTSTTKNAHTWMVGYTRALAAAVWLGTTDGKELKTKDSSFNVFGSNYAGPIWRQFMVDATAAMKLDKSKSAFVPANFPGETPPPTSAPTAAPPSPTPKPEPSPQPEPTLPSPSPPPTPTLPPIPTPSPTGVPVKTPPAGRVR